MQRTPHQGFAIRRAFICLFTMMMFVVLASGWAYSAEFVTFSTLDFGNVGQRVEPGATGISATGSGVGIGPIAVLSDTGDLFDVSTSAVDWRDRGDASPVGPLVFMGEDHIKVNSGTITVTLENLPAGNYRATSYHVDAEFELADTIQISLTDANVTNSSLSVTGNGGQLGRGVGPYSPITVNEAIMTSSSAAFSFASNGINDVIFEFDGSTSVNTNAPQFPISGLLLEQAFVPEPSSSVLASLGIVALMRHRRRFGRTAKGRRG